VVQDWQIVEGQEAQIHDPVYGKAYNFCVFLSATTMKKIDLQPVNFRRVHGDFIQETDRHIPFEW